MSKNASVPGQNDIAHQIRLTQDMIDTRSSGLFKVTQFPKGTPRSAVAPWFTKCDGGPIGRFLKDGTTKSYFFETYGETYGSGDGSTTVQVPNYTESATLDSYMQTAPIGCDAVGNKVYGYYTQNEVDKLGISTYDKTYIDKEMSDMATVLNDNNYKGYKILEIGTKPNDKIIPNGTSYWLSSASEGWDPNVFGCSFIHISNYSMYTSIDTRCVVQILRGYSTTTTVVPNKYGIRRGIGDTWSDIEYVDENILKASMLVYGDENFGKSIRVGKLNDITDSGFYSYQNDNDPVNDWSSGYIYATAYSKSSIGMIFISPTYGIKYITRMIGVYSEWEYIMSEKSGKPRRVNKIYAIDVVSEGSFVELTPPDGVDISNYEVSSITDRGTSPEMLCVYKSNITDGKLYVMGVCVDGIAATGAMRFNVTFDIKV